MQLHLLNRRDMLAQMIAVAAVPTTANGSTRMNTRTQTSGLIDTLHAPGPHPSLGHHADTFGRLIGSWSGEYHDRDPDGSVETGRMEVNFGWVLQGRAVQDTWIALPGTTPDGSTPKRQTYGTTLRLFDPAIEAWRVMWLNPLRGVRRDLIGRRVGDDVVQFCLGQERPEKWVFTDISPGSFRWRSFDLADDGVTWRDGTEFRLTRR